jgi:hypothetical protein
VYKIICLIFGFRFITKEYSFYMSLSPSSIRARWSSGRCARRAIAEAKHRSQWLVLGWVTKIYYLELLGASEGTLSRWSRLHLQSLAPTPVSRRVDVRQAAGHKIIAESLSQHDEKHVVPIPLSGIRVGGRRRNPSSIHNHINHITTIAKHIPLSLYSMTNQSYAAAYLAETFQIFLRDDDVIPK